VIFSASVYRELCPSLFFKEKGGYGCGGGRGVGICGGGCEGGEG